MHKVDDVVGIRHPFLGKILWRVKKVIPSLKEGVMLYRIRSISPNPNKEIEITVQVGTIKENLGGYEEWLVSNKKSDS